MTAHAVPFPLYRDFPATRLLFNCVLGVLFDSKMQWIDQVSQAITKSKKALHGIKLIRKYMTKSEIKMLITSNFYSILYYNCEIWLSRNLHARQKQQILSASACALKILNLESYIYILTICLFICLSNPCLYFK